MFEKNLIVFSDQTYESKDAVIEGMAELVADKVESVEGYAAAVKEREAAFCTYIDHGVAIPHGKTDVVKEPIVIYQRLGEGVVWGEEGREGNSHLHDRRARVSRRQPPPQDPR